MTINAPGREARFDPTRKFVVLNGFRLYGIDYTRGQAFDRSLVTTRLLRQLYENRNLDISDEPSDETKRIQAYLRGEPVFGLMSNSELESYLAKHGKVARRGSDRKHLLAQAEAVVGQHP